MRLLYLELTNFRPFAEAKLDLNADGLIGIRGANGAGKSSLLAAVEWALYGQKRGLGSIPARRSGAAKGEKCQAELQFTSDGHHYRVVRSDSNARVWLDGELLAEGLTHTAQAVVAALGVTRDSFTSTFYARQREIQALNPLGDAAKRRRQLEDLLGLTRLRLACDYARSDARDQELILHTLESEATDENEAERLVKELEQRVIDATPAVETARKRKDEAEKNSKAARKALASAGQRAEQAIKVQGEATVAAAEATSAAERLEATRKELGRVKTAAAELGSLGPTLARLPELQARAGEMEARRQTHEHSTRLRERKHAADASQVNLADELKALLPEDAPDGDGSLADRTHTLEESLRATTARLLVLSEEVPVLSSTVQGAKAQAEAARQLAEAFAELAEVLPARAEHETLGLRLATLEAEAAEVGRDFAEEQEHLEEIRRDGEAARCLRCKRPYGSDFKAIILEYEQSIAELQSRAARISNEVGQASVRRANLQDSLGRIAVLEARKSALGSQVGEQPVGDTLALEAKLDELLAEQGELRATREVDEARLSELRARRDADQALAEKRLAIEQAVRDASAESELLSRELSELPANGYDAEAHEELRQELKALVTVDERARDLKRDAAQVELLERRFASEEEALKEKELHLEGLRNTAEKSASGPRSVDVGPGGPRQRG